MDIYYWNVEECRVITPADEALARVFDPSNDIRKMIDETVCSANDIDELPEPIQPYAYRQMWERLAGGTQEGGEIAVQLSEAGIGLPEITTDAWVLTAGGWLYVRPQGAGDIFSSIYNVWQTGPAQEVRGAAAFTLAQSLSRYTAGAPVPPLTQDELYRWVWDNTKGSASPQYDLLRLNAGIELLWDKVEKGEDIRGLAAGMKGEFEGDAPGIALSQWNLLNAVNELNIYYQKRKDISASSSVEGVLRSLEEAWKAHDIELAYRLYHRLLLVNSSLDPKTVTETLNKNTGELKALLKGRSSEDAERFSRSLTETGLLAEAGVLSAFYFSPLNKEAWAALLKAYEKADAFLENKAPADIAKGWLKFISSGGRSALPAAMALLVELDTPSTFPGVNALNDELWNKILRDVISILEEREAWDGIIAFSKMFGRLSPDNKFQIANAYRRTAFDRTVTKETLTDVYALFLDACRFFAIVNPADVPEYRREAYYLMAGSAWSQLGEFLVDHGGELIESGKAKDNAEVEENIYKYNGLADELLEKAREADPENAEVYVKLAWNKYYLAKFTKNFEESIKAGEADLQTIERLYKEGNANGRQLSSVIRCLMWSYHEKANKLLNIGSYDSARTLLNKAIPLAEKIDYSGLERKEAIDALWLKFKTNYLLAKASPHPGRMPEARRDIIEPLSDESAGYLDKAEAVLTELQGLGETEGELLRMKGWVYYRRGDFDTAEALFKAALKSGSVKHRDDSLRGIMLCCQLSFLSQPNIPLTEKQRLLENWAGSIYARYATRQDPSVLTDLELVCKKAESIGYKMKKGCQK